VVTVSKEDKPKDAKSAKSKDKGKGKGKGKGEGAKKGKRGASGAGERTSVASHPRAAAQVRRAKGWGGIGGFVIAAYLGHKAHVPADQVGLRALAFGVAGYLVAWACAVTVWRHLVLAEMRALVESGRMVVGPDPNAASSPLSEPGQKATPGD
jgi:hypothetical protein